MQLDLDFQAVPEKETARQEVLTVGALTEKIRALLFSNFRQVWVEGEISNFKRHTSGHLYFTLKDDSASLSCVLWARDVRILRGLELRDGLAVCLGGEISVYPNRGTYQLVVRAVKPRGEGDLRARFEALKARLAGEGLFDAGRKRPLPAFPAAIGLITSQTGAAIHDFLKVLWRRNPQVRVLLYPVPVQGRGAAAKIASAVDALNRIAAEGKRPLDLLVITRGGGSLEDLWEFNEEVVARAVAASALPVVSAVGHEIDFTIADFVADVRAPTPSAAAEIISGEAAAVRQFLSDAFSRMRSACRRPVELAAMRLRALRSSAAFATPVRRFDDASQRVDEVSENLRGVLTERRNEMLVSLRRAEEILRARHPSGVLARRREMLGQAVPRLLAAAARARELQTHRLERAAGLLEALSPNATLARGYTITLDVEGRPLTSAKDIRPGGELRTRFHDGEIGSVVKKAEPRKPPARE